MIRLTRNRDASSSRGARRKRDLFEKVFGRGDLRIRPRAALAAS